MSCTSLPNLRERKPKNGLQLRPGSVRSTPNTSMWFTAQTAEQVGHISSIQSRAPCLVHIHGGYWQRGGGETFGCLTEGALARGWSAALPGYTLAPDAGLTQIANEWRTALDWLAANGEEHGVAGPTIVSGWSAGGLAYLGPRPCIFRTGATVAGAARAGKVGADAWKRPTDLPYTAAPCPRFSTSLATLRSSR
jgi:hypothetical protein